MSAGFVDLFRLGASAGVDEYTDKNILRVCARIVRDQVRRVNALYSSGTDAEKLRKGNIHFYSFQNQLARIAAAGDLPALVLTYGTFIPEETLYSGGRTSLVTIHAEYVTGAMKYSGRTDNQLLAFAYVAQNIRRKQFSICGGRALVFDCRMGPVSASRAGLSMTETVPLGWKFDFDYTFHVGMNREYLERVANGTV